MESLSSDTDGDALEGAYWDNPVSGVMSCALPVPGSGEAGTDGARHGVAGSVAALPRLWVVLQACGRARLSLGGVDFALSAGDLALHLEDGPPAGIRLHPHQEGWAFSLGELAAGRRELRSRLPAVLRCNNPATALLAQFSMGLAASGPGLPAGLAKQFLDRLLGMVADILASLPEGGEELPRLARFHLQRIKSYLRAHLREPDLTVKRMATELGLSVSHVHRLFAREGGTVADWFWGERLEGCAADLASPAHAHRTVGDIALSWGFNDLSHFSHAFRKRFGACPRQWRAGAPWRKPLQEALPGAG